MKAKILTLVLCFATLLAFAENRNDINASYKYTKKRTIDANFPVDEDYKLALTGKYSDYKISTWDEDYVSFHVEMIAKANKEENAEDMLYAIDIDFDNIKTKKMIKAQTNIKKNSIKNVSFQITYYVMMPQYIAISIYNQYGDVQIDKLSKDSYIELQYGDLDVDEIAGYAEIEVDYGDINIKKAESITACVNYGDLDVGDIAKAIIKMNYGGTKLDNVSFLNGEFNYSDIAIGNIARTADININYGDLEINSMDEDFEQIKIQTNYSDMELLLDETMTFSYDITLLYGDIKSDMLEKHARKITEKNYQTHMSGDINDEERRHCIIINGNYSDVMTKN